MRNEGADFFLKRVLDNARRAFVTRYSSTETELHGQARCMGLKDNQPGGSIHVARFKARHGGA